MATLASTAISRARIAFPEMGTSVALALLNDAHAEFMARYPLQRDAYMIPIVAGTQEYLLTETAVQIEAAYYRFDTERSQPIESVLDPHEQDQTNPGWRMDGSGVPTSYYITGFNNILSGGIGFYPKPNASTLRVLTATFASPIVITTNIAHGLSNGAVVEVEGVEGNVTANGRYYAKTAGYAVDKFALYYDAGFTNASSGNALYDGGGFVLSSGSPAIKLYIRRNYPLSEGNNLPGCLLNIEPYVYSICRRWAEMTLGPDEWQKWQRLEYDAVHKMEMHLSERAQRSAAVLKPQYLQSRRVF